MKRVLLAVALLAFPFSASAQTSYLAIVAWDQDNQVTKFQPYALEADAEQHIARHGGFVVVRPAADWPHWEVDPIAKTISVVLRPSPAPGPPPLTAEELYDMLKAKGTITDADRPRPKP